MSIGQWIGTKGSRQWVEGFGIGVLPGIDPDDIDEMVVSTLPSTSLFSARFRECAGRALLLPRRR